MGRTFSCRIFGILFGVFGFFLSVQAVEAQAPQYTGKIELVGSIGGDTRLVKVLSETAYMIEDDNFTILDLRDRQNPMYASRQYMPLSTFAVGGNLACLVGTKKVSVYDVTDSYNPINQTPQPLSMDWQANTAEISSNYLVMTGESQLAVVDISSPSQPALLSQISTGQAVSELVLSGSRAYCSTAGIGLQVVDFSDPANPYVAGSYATAGNVQDLDIYGNTVIVRVNYQNYLFLDVSDPAHITNVGNFSNSNIGGELTIFGNHAYIVTYLYGIDLIDISNPANPFHVGRVLWDYTSENKELYAGDGFVLLKRNGAFAVVTIKTPFTFPYPWGYLNFLPRYSMDLKIENDIAYVLSSEYGIFTFDIASPSRIMPMARTTGHLVSEYFSLRTLAVSGQYAYAAGRYDSPSLYVFDVKDPWHPKQAGDYARLGQYENIHADGNILFTDRDMLDISSPTEPVHLASYSLPTANSAVNFCNGILYLGSGYGDFLSLDISSGTAPVILDEIPDTGTIHDIDFYDHYAILACADSGLKIIDIGNPADLREFGSLVPIPYQFFAPPGSVAVVGNLAYVSTFDSYANLWAIDLTDPAQPVIAAQPISGGGTMEPYKSFAASIGESSLRFYRFVPFPPAVPTPTPTITPEPTPTVTPTPIPFDVLDLNHDGRIDSLDLFLLMEQWHETSYATP